MIKKRKMSNEITEYSFSEMSEAKRFADKKASNPDLVLMTFNNNNGVRFGSSLNESYVWEMNKKTTITTGADHE